MRLKLLLFGMLTAAAITAGLLAWKNDAGSRAKSIGVSTPTPGSRSSAPAQVRMKQVELPIPDDDMPLNEQVEKLMATHDPEKAYLAYRLVADCAEFNTEHDQMIFDKDEVKHRNPGSMPGLRGMNEREKRHETNVCSEMTERERQSRLDYLSIAVKAGVPGAAVAFAFEGPFGDPTALETRPSDPLVQEWKEIANTQLTNAAESGTDFSALVYLAIEKQKGSGLIKQDLLLAYRYYLAIGVISEQRYGANFALAKVFAKDGKDMALMANDFSPEQRASELAAAQRIADNATKVRKAANDRSGSVPLKS